MLRCLSCFTDTCSRANAESEEADQKALQELQEIGNLRTPSSPSQALNGSVTRANIETADQGVNTNRGGSADVQQDGQQNQLQASFGRRVKPCHDDFEVNRLVRYLKQGSWAMRAMAAEELWKEAAVRPLVHVLAQHQVAPALVTILRDGTELGKIYAAYTLLVLLKDTDSVDQVVDEGAVQALLPVVASSHLPAARMAALRALARLARHRRAAAVLMALEGHKVLRDLLRDQDHHSGLVKGALVTLYYLGADKNHIQDELGRVGLIPRLLELCVCDNTCVAHQAVQVVKVLSKSVLCCAALQAAGAPAVLESVLAQATQADGSDGNAGKEEDATGSTPATTDGISGRNNNGSIRHTASEAHSPQQQPQANSSQQQPSSNAGSSLRRRSLSSNSDCKPKGSSLRHTAPSSNNNSNLGRSTPSSNDSSGVWHTAPGSNEHSSSSLWHTAPGSKGHSSSGRHTAPSSSINNSSSLWHTALGGNEHSSSMGNTVFSSNNSSINLWHTAPGNDNNNNSSSFNVWRTARDGNNGNSSFNLGQTGSNNDNSNSNLRPTAPEGEHPAQIALERLELVLRTQQNIPSTRPKNHLQPYEVDGPAQQQLLIGTPSPCTPVPLSPTGADTDVALESADNTPARANGFLVPDGAHPHRAAMLNGNSSSSGIGRGLPPVTKGRAQKSGKKRVAWAGVPDQQLQRPVLGQQRAPTPVAALDRQPAQTPTAALDRRPAPQPTAAHDQQPAPHQQLLQQHSTPEEELQRAPGSTAARDHRPALHQRLLQEQSTPELQKHQQQQLQPAPESKAALDRHPAPHQRLLQQQSTPAELQLQPILVPWPLQSKQSTPKDQQQQAHKKEQGKSEEQEALPAHGRESVRQQQPLALFDSGPGGAQHTRNSAAAQAFIAVSDSATRSRTFEQQHKSASHGLSPTEDGRGGAGGGSCAKARLGAGELQDGIGGAQEWSGAGVPQTGVVCGNGGAEVRSGAGDQQTVLVCSNGGTPQDMRSGAGMQQPGAKGAAGVGAQNGTLQDEQEQSCSQHQQQQQQQQQRASPLSLASFDQQQQQQQLHNSKLPNVQPTHQHHEPQTAAMSAASEGKAFPAVDLSTTARAEAGADGAARAADGVSRGTPPSQRQLYPPEQPSPAKAPTESTPSHTSPSSLSSAQPLTPLVPPITNPQLPIPLQHQQSPVPLHRQHSPLGTRPVGHPKTFMSPSTSRRSGASSELYSCDSTSTPILPMPPLPTSSTGVSPRSQPALRTSSFFSCADDVLGGGLREAADTEHGSASDTPDAGSSARIHRRLRPALWNGYPRPRRKGFTRSGSVGSQQLANGDTVSELRGAESAPPFEGTRNSGGAHAEAGASSFTKGSATNGRARRALDMGLGAGSHGGDGDVSAAQGTPVHMQAQRSTSGAAVSDGAPVRYPASVPVPIPSGVERGGRGKEQDAMHGAAQLPNLSPLRLHVPASRSISSRRSSSSSSSSSSSYVSSCMNTGEALLRDSPTTLGPTANGVGSSVFTPRGVGRDVRGPSPLGRRQPSGATTTGEASGATTQSSPTRQHIADQATIGGAHGATARSSPTSATTAGARGTAARSSSTSAFAHPSHLVPLVPILSPPDPPSLSTLTSAHLTPFTSDPNFSPSSSAASTTAKAPLDTSCSSPQSNTANVAHSSLTAGPSGPTTHSDSHHPPTSRSPPHHPRPHPHTQLHKRPSPQHPIRPPAPFLSASAPTFRRSVKETVAAMERTPLPLLQRHPQRGGAGHTNAAAAVPPLSSTTHHLSRRQQHHHHQDGAALTNTTAAAAATPLPAGQHTLHNMHTRPESPVRRASGGSFKPVDARRISMGHPGSRMSLDNGWRRSKTDAYPSHHPLRQPAQCPGEFRTTARPLSSSLCRVVPRQSFDSFQARRGSSPTISECSATAKSTSSRTDPHDSCA